MKKSKPTLLVAAGSFLTLLLFIEELFLILSAVNVFPKHVDETVMIVLVIAPAVITLIYTFFSLLQKTESFLKGILPFLIGLLALVLVTLCTLFVPPLGLFVCGAFAIAGILMFFAGLSLAEKTSSYGILCLNVAGFPFTYLAYGMISSHARWGAADAIWTMVLLVILCAFIIADMVSVVKNQKYKELYEVKKV